MPPKKNTAALKKGAKDPEVSVLVQLLKFAFSNPLNRLVSKGEARSKASGQHVRHKDRH